MTEGSGLEGVSRLLHGVLTRACGAQRSPAPDLSSVVDQAGNLRISNRIERYWIGLLHAAFEIEYSKPTYAVFSKHCPNADFGLHEYLFDLSVVRLRDRPASSPDKGTHLPVIETPVWQVESEMAGNGRSVAIDLGKLACGSAINKLLIVRRPKDGKSAPVSKVNSFVADVAGACIGNFFVAYLPVYAKGHTDLIAHWLNAGTYLPFEMYVRTQSGNTSVMEQVVSPKGVSSA